MQHINLYTSEFHPRKEWLDFNQLILGVIALIFVYSAIGWWSNAETQVLQQQVQQAKQGLEPLRLQKQELDKMLGGRENEESLDNQIAALERDIQLKSLVLNTLKNSDFVASKGFSVLMNDLAKAKSNRIWFNGFEVKKDVLELQGQTMDPKLLTDWIESATKNPALNRQFATVMIQQNPNDSRVYDFSLTGGVLMKYE